MTARGRLFGVGVGPGDPELMTIKAQRVIAAADVVAYPGAEHGRSVSRAIAAPYMRSDQIEVPLRYPVTTGETDHPDGYEGAIAEFYDGCAEELAIHLDAGRDVAVLCEGDPFLYGSYMYLHDRLASRYRSRGDPGGHLVQRRGRGRRHAARAPRRRADDPPRHAFRPMSSPRGCARATPPS